MIKEYNDGLNNLFLIDESKNPTGTHKDRLAEKIIAEYNQELQKGRSLSMVSAGSAAIAVQNVLDRYGFKPLKVLMNENSSKEDLKLVEDWGAKIYLSNLDKWLSSEEILVRTENYNGLDISSNEFQKSLEPYSELVEKVDVINPDIIFVPYGSGVLFDCFESKNYEVVGGFTSNKNSIATKIIKTNVTPSSNLVDISDDYIRKVSGIPTRLEIDFEPSALGGLAAYNKIKDFDMGNVAVILTGKTKNYN